MADTEDIVTFGGGFVSVVWKDGIRPKLRTGPDRVRRAAIATTQSMAPVVENHMKTTAPWTDRTGNARNGLAARAYAEGDEIGIVLYHQVDYGVYLETRFGGRYAVIQPTIDEMGPVVMARFDRLMERI